jgi:succinate dehydrogenase / fumarate reductase iron-sulfur subunit
MHPIDTGDRLQHLKDEGGIALCNITKCCSEVCPEHIKITDNAIIPLKERVADRYYDPVQSFWRRLRGGGKPAAEPAPAAVEAPPADAAGTEAATGAAPGPAPTDGSPS